MPGITSPAQRKDGEDAHTPTTCAVVLSATKALLVEWRAIETAIMALLGTSLFVPPPPLYKLRPCPSYSRRRDRINLVSNFNLVPNVVQPHKTWVSRICQSHRVMDTFVVSVCPLEPTPFLSPLLQVMILVTPMMLALNLFGLRLPEVCGEWPMSLMGSCILQENTCKAISQEGFPSRTFVGFSCFIACEIMGGNLNFHVSNTFLRLHAFGNRGGG